MRKDQECSDDKGDDEGTPIVRRVRQRTGEVSSLTSGSEEGGLSNVGEEETHGPDAGRVEIILGQLEEMMKERDLLRLVLEVIRRQRDTVVVEKDVLLTEKYMIMPDRDRLQTEREGLQHQLDAEKARGDGAMSVLERQLAEALQDARYHAGQSSYYYSMLTMHSSGVPMTPYSHFVSQPSEF